MGTPDTHVKTGNKKVSHCLIHSNTLLSGTDLTGTTTHITSPCTRPVNSLYVQRLQPPPKHPLQVNKVVHPKGRHWDSIRVGYDVEPNGKACPTHGAIILLGYMTPSTSLKNVSHLPRAVELFRIMSSVQNQNQNQNHIIYQCSVQCCASPLSTGHREECWIFTRPS